MALLLSRAGPPSRESLKQMLGAAPHRGACHEIETLGQVGVGVCNDSDRTSATLARSDGRLAVFCGALDNEKALRSRLRRAGGRVPDHGTPAAVLLAAVDRWGREALGRFRGSFAGAVSDGHQVFCFRDQFGASPLFYHDGGEGLFAATEVKQVLAAAPIRREPDMDHLHGLIFGGIDRSTAFRGVLRVPSRSILTAGEEPGATVREYWDPASVVETADLDPEQAAEGTREALDTAVERALTGDDTILLSGGLDSPALAASAVRLEGRPRPILGLTGVYPDHPSVDERRWTQMAADHLEMPLHEFTPDAGSLDDVKEWVRRLDGPVDVVSIPEMAQSYRAARELGARTVLTGEIAEMLFDNRTHLLDHYLVHGRFRPLYRYLTHLRARGFSRTRLALELLRAVAPTALVAAYASLRSPGSPGTPEWIDVEHLRRARRDPPAWKLKPRRRWPTMQLSMLKGSGYMFEASEICASVCGVHDRRPFADVDLWEFVLSLPAEVKFPNHRSKPLLRKAMRGRLPDELIDRKDKTVFNEYHLDRADYPKLRSLLVETPRYMEGIDYGRIREALETEEMDIVELQWARDLARVHAFLEQF